ncbi:unnamed protein product [Owenia fusiformis]|uniref:Polypeptide N-acetylgalactosaminyltransferase n=1 Tax=Owenia fusiformis TaxID=6347 RepID=A0A8S4PEI4_OWEFU|nr:unnamed protein product [Owenia fusiformis]
MGLIFKRGIGLIPSPSWIKPCLVMLIIVTAGCVYLAMDLVPIYMREVRLNWNLEKMSNLGFPINESRGFSEDYLNTSASHSTALDRPLPDTRDKLCRTFSQRMGVSFQSVSIIMPFYNEVWSMLIRSLYSILKRTPSHLLKEIILVDDFSSRDYLKRPLDNFAKDFPKIKIIRQKSRGGLMVARMTGARAATGGVLVFLDAHIECLDYWLVPLLDSLTRMPTSIAVPTADDIDPKTIKYRTWSSTVHGGFDWKLEYVWKFLPEHETKRRTSSIDPIRSPTLIGFAFAVSRSYFFSFGGFDEGMRIWGGENLEISFRAWMCGEGVYIIPCSRIAHVFRSYLPYSFPDKHGKENGGNIIQKNLQRAAEVWMGEYRPHFYAAIGKYVPLSKEENKTLQQRIQLKQTLKCKDFKWYLNKVIPEMIIPANQSIYFGQLKNFGTGACMTFVPDKDKMQMQDCQVYANQLFSLTKTGNLILNEKCLTVYQRPNDTTPYVKVTQCITTTQGIPKNQTWVFNTTVPNTMPIDNRSKGLIGRFMQQFSNNIIGCMCHITDHDKAQVVDFEPCKKFQTSYKYQYWVFSHKMNYAIWNERNKNHQSGFE